MRKSSFCLILELAGHGKRKNGSLVAGLSDAMTKSVSSSLKTSRELHD